MLNNSLNFYKIYDCGPATRMVIFQPEGRVSIPSMSMTLNLTLPLIFLTGL